MAAENNKQSADRRKRVQFLKKLIIISLVTSILLPTVLCVVLFVKVSALEKQLAGLENALMGAQEVWAQADEPMDVANASADLADADRSAEAVTDREVSDGLKEVSAELTEEQLLEVSPDVRKVYLTFDDGPSSNTDDILDILAEYDVKATFFVVGKESEWAEEMYMRIVEEGHTLGLHSYSHVYEDIYASKDAYAADLLKLQDYVYTLTGVKSTYVRFPGGSSNRVSRTDMQDLIRYLDEEGMVYYDWNISSKDAEGQLSAAQIVENALDGIEKSDTIIILFHDAASKHSTVEALPILIEEIQAMENTVLLPISDYTVPVQHITITQEETED